jgi:hypothetical protein
MPTHKVAEEVEKVNKVVEYARLLLFSVLVGRSL